MTQSPWRRAVEIAVRNQAAHADAAVRGRDERGAAVHFHRADEGLGRVFDDLLEPAGIAPVATALDGHAHAVAVHHADHLRRRQEHGFFLALDPHEAEARAIGAHDAFGDPWKCGCWGVPRRARRALPVFMHGRAPRAPLAVVSFHRTRFYAPPDRAGQTSQALRSWVSPIDRLAAMPPRCPHRWGWHMNKVSKISRVAYMSGGAMLAACAAAADLTLYADDGYQGRALNVVIDERELSVRNFNDRASSVVIESGAWVLCSGDDFGGKCVTLEPGRYASLRAVGLDDDVSSVRHRDPASIGEFKGAEEIARAAASAEPGTDIVLYADDGYAGRSHSAGQPQADLQSEILQGRPLR